MSHQPPSGSSASERPHMLLYAILAMVVAVVALGAVVFLIVADGSREAGGRSGVAVEAVDDQEQTAESAKAAAQHAFDTYAAGQYGEFWDLWTEDAQTLIGRDNYLRLFELCKPLSQGLRFEIKGATVQGDTATVQVSRLIGIFAYQMKWDGERWRYVPDPQAQTDYQSKSVEQMAQEKKTSGACAGSTPSATASAQTTAPTSAP